MSVYFRVFSQDNLNIYASNGAWSQAAHCPQYYVQLTTGHTLHKRMHTRAVSMCSCVHVRTVQSYDDIGHMSRWRRRYEFFFPVFPISDLFFVNVIILILLHIPGCYTLTLWSLLLLLLLLLLSSIFFLFFSRNSAFFTVHFYHRTRLLIQIQLLLLLGPLRKYRWIVISAQNGPDQIEMLIYG